MNFIKKLLNILGIKKFPKSPPILIINKNSESKEYNSIDEAIAELENDPNVPKDKLDKLKESIKKFKYGSTIKIVNGEIED